MQNKVVYALLVSVMFVFGCKKGEKGAPTGLNLFSLSDDIAFGAQMDSTIRSNPSEYPILSRSQYPEAYAYIEAMRDKLLASGQVQYAEEFDWKVTIIRDDNVLNAFATPGGYMYIYTGLAKYLETEHALAGVVGHEMAHADRRHSTTQLTQQYGISTLLSILLGNNPGLLAEISSNLLLLKFGREDESEADTYSVNYMCPTDYAADGAAEFFAKLIEEEQSSGSTPEFLSTHPSPENRVEAIREYKTQSGCEGTGEYDAAYQNFLSKLP